MLEGELSDPRIFPSVVTEVVLAPGGKAARVFVAVHGGERGRGVDAGGADVRAGVHPGRRSGIEWGCGMCRELSFAIDRSEKMTGRMDELLGRMKKRDKKREEKAAAAAGTSPAL